MLGVVRGAEPRAQQLERLLDAARLVDRDLLADREVHRQVQERIGPAALDRIDRGARGFGIGEVGLVLRMLGDPVGCDRFERGQRFLRAELPMRGAEEVADVVLRRGEHGAILHVVRSTPLNRVDKSVASGFTAQPRQSSHPNLRDRAALP